MMEKILFAAKDVNGTGRAFKLSNVDFELPCGYIMGIIGKNGAGKTTFFKYILDEKKHYKGQFFFDGSDISLDHALFMDNVGFVSDDNEFFLQRTGRQNAELLGRFYSQFDMELFKSTMEAAGLSIDKTTGRMSRGEYIKFQLAFAIAHKPKLLLLDEATAGMDPVYRRDFYKLLRNLLEVQECSIIMSSHIEDDIKNQFDYIACFENGNLVYFKENELS
jgi:ABC-2 type transport system ATP-binding protein